MVKRILLLLLQFQLFCAFSQPVSTKLDSIVSAYKKETCIYDFYKEANSDELKYLNEFAQLATQEKLLEWIDDTSVVLAANSIRALLLKSYDKIPELFLNLINSNKSVRIKSGCVVSAYDYREVLYFGALYQNKTKENNIRNAKLDSIILEQVTENVLLVAFALDNRIYTGRSKQQIVYLGLNKKNTDALLYLSRCHKAEFADTLKQIFLCLIDIHCNKKFDNYNQLEMMEELLEYNDEEIKPKVIATLKNMDYLEQEDIYRFRKFHIYPVDLER